MQQNQSIIFSDTSHLKAWIVTLSAGLFFFYDFIQLNMFGTLNPVIVEVFQLDATQMGYLSSTYLIASVAMLPFSGAILDRYPTRHVILTAMAVCTFSTLLFALAPNVWVAAVARFLCGGSTAFCFLSCIVLASRWFPANKMAQVNGVVVAMAMLGGYLSQEPLAVLLKQYSWKQALIIDTLIGVVLFVIMFILIENYPSDQEPPALTTEPVMACYSKAASNPQNIICGIYTSLMNLLLFVFGASWGISYLQHVYHLDLSEAGRITSMLYLGTIIGSPLAGWLSDRIQQRRSLMIWGAIISFVISFAVLMRPGFNVPQLNVIFFLLGLTTSTQVLTYPIIFESNPPHITGICEGLAAVFIMSAGAIFQPIYGMMMNAHWNGLIVNGLPKYAGGDHHFAYLLFPLCLLLCIFLAKMVKETHCQPIWKQ